MRTEYYEFTAMLIREINGESTEQYIHTVLNKREGFTVRECVEQWFRQSVIKQDEFVSIQRQYVVLVAGDSADKAVGLINIETVTDGLSYEGYNAFRYKHSVANNQTEMM